MCIACIAFVKLFMKQLQIGAVLVGYDNCINNYKLSYAMHAIKYNPNCLFIATNTDNTLPFADVELPGAGTIVAALRTAVAPKEPIVIGKPETLLLEIIEKEYGIDRARTIMIGDRLETDISFGNRGKVKSCAVLTGIATREELATVFAGKDEDLKPGYVMESFGDIYKLLHQ